MTGVPVVKRALTSSYWGLLDGCWRAGGGAGALGAGAGVGVRDGAGAGLGDGA